ncbi:MAG: hypothetical protein QOE93_174 [Actinomycetota bacterium]|jgi:hypothetical protein|nr:hypothetical protein [Actinomycetota bacterium]
MGIGVSVFLIALGAVLAFAVNVQTTGIDLATVGVILMVVGGIGLATTLLLFGDNGWWDRRGVVRSDRVDDYDVVSRPVEVREVREVPVEVREVPVTSRRRVTRRVDY